MKTINFLYLSSILIFVNNFVVRIIGEGLSIQNNKNTYLLMTPMFTFFPYIFLYDAYLKISSFVRHFHFKCAEILAGFIYGEAVMVTEKEIGLLICSLICYFTIIAIMDIYQEKRRIPVYLYYNGAYYCLFEEIKYKYVRLLINIIYLVCWSYIIIVSLKSSDLDLILKLILKLSSPCAEPISELKL